MTDEETPVAVLAVLITDATQTVLILSMGLHFEKSEWRIVNKTLNWKRGKIPQDILNTKTYSHPHTSALEMLIVFMFLLQNSPTKMEPVDTDMWDKLYAGSMDPVLYRLDFPVSSPLPTIKSITVNQNVICRGTRPQSKH